MSEINCDPNALMEASKCYCIPKGKEQEVMIYLLQQIAGDTSTPKELMEKSKCLCFPDSKTREQVMTYLLCLLAKDGAGPCEPGVLTLLATQLRILSIVGDNLDSEFSAPSLATMPLFGSIMINQSKFTSILFPVLTMVASDITLLVNNLLTDLDFSKLQSAGSFDCSNSAVLANLDLSSLTTSIGGISASSCPLLTTVLVPVWNVTDGTPVNFSACALNATSVELILRRCVLAGVTTCTIDLSGGTNAGTASLSAQGQADVVTLGVQLTINP